MKFYEKISSPYRAALRYCLVAVVALALSASLTSCFGDDDDDDQENQYPIEMIGSWTATQQTIVKKVAGLEDETTVDNHPAVRLEINVNGTFQTYVLDPESYKWVSDVRGAWAYNASNSMLIVAPTEDTRQFYTIVSVSKTQLVLKEVVAAVSEDNDTPVTFIITTVYTPTSASPGDL